MGGRFTKRMDKYCYGLRGVERIGEAYVDRQPNQSGC